MHLAGDRLLDSALGGHTASIYELTTKFEEISEEIYQNPYIQRKIEVHLGNLERMEEFYKMPMAQ
jgi:predicted transcriptional regulator